PRRPESQAGDGRLRVSVVVVAVGRDVVPSVTVAIDEDSIERPESRRLNLVDHRSQVSRHRGGFEHNPLRVWIVPRAIPRFEPRYRLVPVKLDIVLPEGGFRADAVQQGVRLLPAQESANE